MVAPEVIIAGQERPEDAARRLARRLLAVEDLHAQRVRDVDGHRLSWCRECGQNWPCPTFFAATLDKGEPDAEPF